jgi:hypothetical protein
MCLGYGVAVNVDGEGGAPYYTVNLEGWGDKQTEGQCFPRVASDY